MNSRFDSAANCLPRVGEVAVADHHLEGRLRLQAHHRVLQLGGEHVPPPPQQLRAHGRVHVLRVEHQAVHVENNGTHGIDDC